MKGIIKNAPIKKVFYEIMYYLSQEKFVNKCNYIKS